MPYLRHFPNFFPPKSDFLRAVWIWDYLPQEELGSNSNEVHQESVGRHCTVTRAGCNSWLWELGGTFATFFQIRNYL